MRGEVLQEAVFRQEFAFEAEVVAMIPLGAAILVLLFYPISILFLFQAEGSF